MSENKKVYISGDLSIHTEKEFEEIEKQLILSGYIAVNPLKIKNTYPGLSETDYSYIEEVLKRRCNAIYLMPGWTDSYCIKADLIYALNNNYDVIKKSE